jgi:raffinose/stachyose/melibiose transport system permease protein
VGILSAASGGRRRREPSKIPYYVILVILALFAIGPLVVVVFNSLKTNAEIGRNPLGPPLSPVFQNFPDAWTQGDFSTTMVNSTILTLGTIIGVSVIAATGA